MAKLRKMLGSANSIYIVALMRQIETQSKMTIANWAMDYAENNLLPIYSKYFPNDNRPKLAMDSARAWLKGEAKFQLVKGLILNSCHQAARECEDFPAAQAAARACGQAASAIHVATHGLGIAFYGAAAIAYEKLGLNEKASVYDNFAKDVCDDMLRCLISVSVLNEPNKAKINWNC